MIENEAQYETTKQMLENFREGLKNIETVTWIGKTQADGIMSSIDDLERECLDYETRKQEANQTNSGSA